MILTKVVTAFRAASIAEDLKADGIEATIVSPKWIDKHLPPPKIEIHINSEDEAAARQILEVKV